MKFLVKQNVISILIVLFLVLVTVGCDICANPKTYTTVKLSTKYPDSASCTAAIPLKCTSTAAAPNAACNAYCAAGFFTCIGVSAPTTKFAGACFPVEPEPADYYFNCTSVYKCKCV